MANSQQKAEALKDSYVKGIMEGAQASLHLDPTRGAAGLVNDGDPSVYLYGPKGDVMRKAPGEMFANPSKKAAPNSGEGEVRQLTPQQQNTLDQELDMERGYGTGPMADGGVTLKQGAFAGPALAGAMGMEQGNTAGIVVDLKHGGIQMRNDGNPRIVVRDGNRMGVERSPHAANPIAGAGYGAGRKRPMSRQEMSNAADMLHRHPNQVDTIGGHARSQEGLDRIYNDAMYQSYNR